MARRLGFLALLAVAFGCHDSPTALEVTSAPATIKLTNALAVSRTLLDDPLVAALIAEADHTRVTRTMRQVRDEVTVGDLETLGRTLRAAREELTQAPDDENMLARAALSVTLDAMHTLLDNATTADSGANVPLTNLTRSP